MFAVRLRVGCYILFLVFDGKCTSSVSGFRYGCVDLIYVPVTADLLGSINWHPSCSPSQASIKLFVPAFALFKQPTKAVVYILL